MVKRISCRVVRSVRLGKAGNGLGRGVVLNNEQREGCSAAANLICRDGGNSVVYTRRLGIARVSVADWPVGLVVDYYA